MQSEESNVLVRARGVTKSFGEDDARIPVLKGVDLDVALGEIHLLVGPSGSGKTTLLSVIAGILDLDEGEITVLGQSIPDLSPSAKTNFRSKYFGFIFQEFNLVPKRSLTGDTTERVDTRVLQVIYGLEKPDFPVYVGQQVDVFIKRNDTSMEKISLSKEENRHDE